jgi:branched-chain amino acid transport system permease protein
MGSAWLQFIASGLTAGAIYALVALGFSIIYNASGAINFAQGEFVMIGGMSAVTLLALGLPLLVALPLAVLASVVVALIIEKLAIEPARHAGTVTLIIITIGVALFLRGLAQLLWGKGVHRLPSFSSEQPIEWLGATLLPQSLWVMGGAALAVVALSAFYGHTLLGKAMRATSCNRIAAQLVGINTRGVLFASFGLAAGRLRS